MTEERKRAAGGISRNRETALSARARRTIPRVCTRVSENSAAKMLGKTGSCLQRAERARIPPARGVSLTFSFSRGARADPRADFTAFRIRREKRACGIRDPKLSL